MLSVFGDRGSGDGSLHSEDSVSSRLRTHQWRPYPSMWTLRALQSHRFARLHRRNRDTTTIAHQRTSTTRLSSPQHAARAPRALRVESPYAPFRALTRSHPEREPRTAPAATASRSHQDECGTQLGHELTCASEAIGRVLAASFSGTGLYIRIRAENIRSGHAGMCAFLSRRLFPRPRPAVRKSGPCPRGTLRTQAEVPPRLVVLNVRSGCS